MVPSELYGVDLAVTDHRLQSHFIRQCGKECGNRRQATRIDDQRAIKVGGKARYCEVTRPSEELDGKVAIPIAFRQCISHFAQVDDTSRF
ncbi:hypothetical protein DMC47_20005 [Nostoc sp. 3335mG]|nr:hypothetical protein DMC47_20005 [Nostoc sp. 3335mG]